MQVAQANAASMTDMQSHDQWIAWYVINEKTLDDEVAMALVEAVWTESEWHNYSNNGVHGPEDDTGTPSTPDQLAAAASTQQYPHDAVGTDHASAGVLQQQVGPGFSWGSVGEVMDPQHAMEEFADRALTSKKRGKGAEHIAQDIQRSAHSDGANYKSHFQDARDLINRMQTSC